MGSRYQFFFKNSDFLTESMPETTPASAPMASDVTPQRSFSITVRARRRRLPSRPSNFARKRLLTMTVPLGSDIHVGLLGSGGTWPEEDQGADGHERQRPFEAPADFLERVFGAFADLAEGFGRADKGRWQWLALFVDDRGLQVQKLVQDGEL